MMMRVLLALVMLVAVMARRGPSTTPKKGWGLDSAGSVPKPDIPADTEKDVKMVTRTPPANPPGWFGKTDKDQPYWRHVEQVLDGFAE